MPRGDALAELATGCSNDLAHRGPDGAGYWQNNPKNPTAMLVHRRLAVLDPTPRSDQPYRGRFDGRRLALAYNGEIFNFRELRGGLDRRWKTDGDTEVLLAAYAARGEACVEDFEGMFAFAVVDESEKGQPKLVLARDPAGEKPLFVAVAKHGGRVGGVAFASELTCLRRMIARLRWPGIELRPGMHALQDYLAWGYVPGADTIHVGISKLLPGHTLTVTREGATRQRYFDAGGVYELGEPDRWAGAVTLTRQLVGAAVRRRLISDVPIGCLLSGGIDSSVVALHMAEALQREGRTLQTFSIGFDDPRYDESPHAAEVAKHLGARHHAFTVRPEEIDVTGDLPKLARVLGE
ncbi:MAG: asparagine synthase-related protein, partial [Planctomycetota bacterium]